MTFTGDTNTGVYRGGTDILGFSTVGLVRATINASGDFLMNYDADVAGILSAARMAMGSISIGTDGSSSQNASLYVAGGANAWVNPAGTVVFQDGFTEASDTTLASHVPDTVGTSWTLLIQNTGVTMRAQATDKVDATATVANAGALYTADGTYPSADYEVKITVDVADSGDDVAILAARVQDASNMYLVTLSTTAANIDLYKEVAGVWTVLGTSNVVIAVGDTIKLRVAGSNITVYRDDTLLIAVTDTDITAAGKAGLGIGYVALSTDDADTTWDMDDFTVTAYDATLNAAIFASGAVGIGTTSPWARLS
ncbi:MAG: hypothetical protein UY61_C0081G0003, partial [Candidatus Adlerbacteria bacterium GW2011_GWC1_50_9]